MSNPYFTATNYTDYIVGTNFIAAQLQDSTGTISFNASYNVYFIVIGGGGGGGGGGHNDGTGHPTYPSGGGAGAGAFGNIIYNVSPSTVYSYSIGSGGVGNAGNIQGTPGGNSMLSFSGTETITANGGDGGKGHFDGNNGGVAGILDVSGVTPIITSSGGNGGTGVQSPQIGPDPLGNGTAGIASSPTFIEIYPDTVITIGGGGGGADAHDPTIPPPNPYKGGGGGNGIGGTLGTGPSSGTDYNGQDGLVPGAGGGGGGQPGDGSPVIAYNVTYGGDGKSGAIYFWIQLPTPAPTPPFSNRPGPIQICNSRFAKCKLNKKLGAAFQSGNVTIPGATLSTRLSEIVRVQTYMRNATFVIQDISLNVYGQTSGSPFGYGSSPKNTF